MAGDDDLLALARSATTAALDAEPDASMVYGWCDYIDEHGTVVFSSRAGRVAARILRFGPNLVPQPGSLMRLSDVLAVGGVDEALSLSMDLDLFLRLRRRGRLIALNRPGVVPVARRIDDGAVGGASADEADRVRMRYMSAPGAGAYRLARWPGRWALRLVKSGASQGASCRAGMVLSRSRDGRTYSATSVSAAVVATGSWSASDEACWIASARARPTYRRSSASSRRKRITETKRNVITRM